MNGVLISSSPQHLLIVPSRLLRRLKEDSRKNSRVYFSGTSRIQRRISKKHHLHHSCKVSSAKIQEAKTPTEFPPAPILIPSDKWSILDGGVTAPLGFTASSLCANLRTKTEKADLSLLMCPTGATTAGVFTLNVICAAPVHYDKRILQKTSDIKAVLINAGQANAATGPQGYEDVEQCVKSLSQELSVDEDSILVMSTGVIGQRIKLQNIVDSIPSIVASLHHGADVDCEFATAITTTDLAYKTVAVELEIDGKKVRVGGACKGSGMIHPNMATLLGLVTCDAPVESELWKSMLRKAVNVSFNQITVDGDTSTNDTILALASGQVDLPLISDPSSMQALKLQEAIEAVCQALAKSVAWDGEGATSLLEIHVHGANTDGDAAIIAKSIANSSLTKAAIFGHDPNWGRIAAAAGYAGVEFSADDLDITLGNIQLMKKGVPLDFDRSKASLYLKSQCSHRSVVSIDVKVGNSIGQATVWGCDLSYDYIKINAEYTT